MRYDKYVASLKWPWLMYFPSHPTPVARLIDVHLGKKLRCKGIAIACGFRWENEANQCVTQLLMTL